MLVVGNTRGSTRWLITAVLCLTIWAQCAATAAGFEQGHEVTHFCLLCHMGVLPFLQAEAPLAVSPAFFVEWRPASLASDSGYSSLLLSTSSPRAPPV